MSGGLMPFANARGRTDAAGNLLVALDPSSVLSPLTWLGNYEIVTPGAGGASASPSVYETRLVTDGSAGDRTLDLHSASGFVIGQRALVTMKTVTAAGDTVSVTGEGHIDGIFGAGYGQVGPLVNPSSVSLSTAGDFILFEYAGGATPWVIVWASSGVVTY